MAVWTASDVFYNSKSKTKLSAKTLGKQAGINALWVAGSACLFAYPLAKMYTSSKQKKHDELDVSTAAAAILMEFRLYMASRPHPKWKNIRFGKFF